MRVTVKFDRRADLTNIDEVLTQCLAWDERETSHFDGSTRELTYTTRLWASAVADRWEDQGFGIEDFESFSFSQESPSRLPEIFMPGGSDISVHAMRYIGRTRESLTETEEELVDHLSMHGELYWATYDETTGVVSTDCGHPGTPVSIRVALGTTPHDAAVLLWDVVDYYMSLLEDDYPLKSSHGKNIPHESPRDS